MFNLQDGPPSIAEKFQPHIPDVSRERIGAAFPQLPQLVRDSLKRFDFRLSS
jgi:hypothetical protein